MAKFSKKWIVIAIVLVVAGVLGYKYWKSRQSALPAGIVSGNGRIEAKLVDASAKQPLRVREVLVDEGDLVRPGQVLVRLDTSTLEEELATNEAAVATAREQFAAAKTAIATAKANIAAANAALRECFSKVVIDCRTGVLVFHWRHSPEVSEIRFASMFTDLDAPPGPGPSTHPPRGGESP